MREASAHVCAIGRLCLDTDPGAFRLAHSSMASKNLMALEDTHWVGRSGCTSTPATMIERARDIFHSAFRANFGPMWLHALGKGHRAHRLDPPQYDGVHQNNAAALLCAQLDDASALYATRVALQSTAAATYTMGEAVFALGLDRDGKRAAEVIDIGNRCSRHATSTLVAAAPLGSRALGMLLQFARTAQICETVLIVELGARTAPDELSAAFDQVMASRNGATAEAVAAAARKIGRIIEDHALAQETGLFPTLTERHPLTLRHQLGTRYFLSGKNRWQDEGASPAAA